MIDMEMNDVEVVGVLIYVESVPANRTDFTRVTESSCSEFGYLKRSATLILRHTTRKPPGNSLVQPPQRVNVSSIAGISIVATTTSSGFSQRSQISIVWARAAQSAAIELGGERFGFYDQVQFNSSPAN